MAKVLVAYASKYGSTAEIAEAIAVTLRDCGLEADCVDASEVEGLAGYDAVVLGSAVYLKRWRGEAKRFLGRHEEELAERPFWAFSSGPVGEDSDEQMGSDGVQPPRIMKRVHKLGAREHVAFAGSLPAEGEGGFMAKAMTKGTPPEYRDRRDWDEIRGWAEKIAAELGAGAATG